MNPILQISVLTYKEGQVETENVIFLTPGLQGIRVVYGHGKILAFRRKIIGGRSHRADENLCVRKKALHIGNL